MIALDEELEQTRKKKLKEMQKYQQAEAQIRILLRTILDDEAYDRMMNVNIANPELYRNAAQGCVSIYQKLGRKLGNKEVLFILRRIKSDKEETTIRFDRK